MTKRMRWALAGGVAALVMAIFVGFKGGGAGSGGDPMPVENPDPTEAPSETPDPFFTIEVNESRILVGDQPVTGPEAAVAAKNDGRRIHVRWVNAMTDAENELQKAIRKAGLKIAQETRDP